MPHLVVAKKLQTHQALFKLELHIVCLVQNYGSDIVLKPVDLDLLVGQMLWQGQCLKSEEVFEAEGDFPLVFLKLENCTVTVEEILRGVLL